MRTIQQSMLDRAFVAHPAEQVLAVEFSLQLEERTARVTDDFVERSSTEVRPTLAGRNDRQTNRVACDDRDRLACCSEPCSEQFLAVGVGPRFQRVRRFGNACRFGHVRVPGGRLPNLRKLPATEFMAAWPPLAPPA